MEEIYHSIETVLKWGIQYAILLIELIGAAALIVAIVRAVIGIICRRKHVRLHLSEGIALTLEFKMGGELLRTVIVQDWHELLILGAVIALHVVLTVLIHWEIKVEERRKKEREALE